MTVAAVEVDPLPFDGCESRTPSPNSSRAPDEEERVFIESAVLASTPLGPFCDSRSLQSAPVGETTDLHGLRRSEDGRGWVLVHPNWTVHSPIYPTGKHIRISSSHVYDVYAGLLLALNDAGIDSAGRIRIPQLRFMQLIGWGDEIGGSQYKKLESALDYLYHATIQSDEIERFIDRATADSTRGTYKFHILQGWGAVSPANSGDALAREQLKPSTQGDDIVVEFSRPFLALMSADGDRVVYRMSDYLSFKPGMERALYRFARYLATQPLTRGEIRLSLDDLFSAIGSTRRGLPPAKCRQLLGEAFEKLKSQGSLKAAPEFEVGAEGHTIVLRPSTPPAPEFDALLLRTLLAYGVQPQVASNLLAKDSEWVAVVVAAATLGMLVAKQTLPAMLVYYCKRPNLLLDPKLLPRFDVGPSGSRTDVTGNAASEYLEASFHESRVYLDGLDPDVQKKWRAQFEKNGRDAWVVKGLLLAAAREARAGWSLDAFLRSRGARR